MIKIIQKGRFVLTAHLDINTKFVDITVIPTLILVKNPYSYALEFKWLTFSLQIEYTRDNFNINDAFNLTHEIKTQ